MEGVISAASTAFRGVEIILVGPMNQALGSKPTSINAASIAAASPADMGTKGSRIVPPQ
jgi:hypothetical protein